MDDLILDKQIYKQGDWVRVSGEPESTTIWRDNRIGKQDLTHLTAAIEEAWDLGRIACSSAPCCVVWPEMPITQGGNNRGGDKTAHHAKKVKVRLLGTTPYRLRTCTPKYSYQ